MLHCPLLTQFLTHLPFDATSTWFSPADLLSKRLCQADDNNNIADANDDDTSDDATVDTDDDDDDDDDGVVVDVEGEWWDAGGEDILWIPSVRPSWSNLPADVHAVFDDEDGGDCID